MSAVWVIKPPRRLHEEQELPSLQVVEGGQDGGVDPGRGQPVHPQIPEERHPGAEPVPGLAGLLASQIDRALLEFMTDFESGELN